MGQTLFFVFAVFLAGTLRRIDRLIHREDDVGHGQLRHVAGDAITAAGSTHRINDIAPAQLAEQLLQIGQ